MLFMIVLSLVDGAFHCIDQTMGGMAMETIFMCALHLGINMILVVLSNRVLSTYV
jgi:hypothetical protein